MRPPIWRPSTVSEWSRRSRRPPPPRGPRGTAPAAATTSLGNGVPTVREAVPDQEAAAGATGASSTPPGKGGRRERCSGASSTPAAAGGRRSSPRARPGHERPRPGAGQAAGARTRRRPDGRSRQAARHVRRPRASRPPSARQRGRGRWPAMQEPLEELLAHLRGAIDAAEEGADNKEELARLSREVERRLSDEDPDGVVDDLREEVTKFEVSHPNLSSLINRTADALSAMGSDGTSGCGRADRFLRGVEHIREQRLPHQGGVPRTSKWTPSSRRSGTPPSSDVKWPPGQTIALRSTSRASRPRAATASASRRFTHATLTGSLRSLPSRELGVVEVVEARRREHDRTACGRRRGPRAPAQFASNASCSGAPNGIRRPSISTSKTSQAPISSMATSGSSRAIAARQRVGQS